MVMTHECETTVQNLSLRVDGIRRNHEVGSRHLVGHWRLGPRISMKGRDTVRKNSLLVATAKSTALPLKVAFRSSGATVDKNSGSGSERQVVTLLVAKK